MRELGTVNELVDHLFRNRAGQIVAYSTHLLGQSIPQHRNPGRAEVREIPKRSVEALTIRQFICDMNMANRGYLCNGC